MFTSISELLNLYLHIGLQGHNQTLPRSGPGVAPGLATPLPDLLRELASPTHFRTGGMPWLTKNITQQIQKYNAPFTRYVSCQTIRMLPKLIHNKVLSMPWNPSNKKEFWKYLRKGVISYKTLIFTTFQFVTTPRPSEPLPTVNFNGPFSHNWLLLHGSYIKQVGIQNNSTKLLALHFTDPMLKATPCLQWKWVELGNPSECR